MIEGEIDGAELADFHFGPFIASRLAAKASAVPKLETLARPTVGTASYVDHRDVRTILCG